MAYRKRTDYDRRKNTRIGLTGVLYINSRVVIDGVMIKPDYTLDQFRRWCYAQDKFDRLYDRWESKGFNDGLKPGLRRIDFNKPHTMDNIELSIKSQVKLKGVKEFNTPEHIENVRLCRVISQVAVV